MEQYKKQEIYKKVQQTFRCPKCNAIIEEHFQFCPECGTPLQNLCPNCKKPLRSVSSELCENCGEWLLKNQCRFCYASITENDSFCPNCGLPTNGIECPKCKTKSFFHFCKNCNEPLTEFAFQMIKKLQDNSFKLEEMKENKEINFLNNQEARAYYQAQLYLLKKELQLNDQSINESQIIKKQENLNEKEILEQYKEYISKTEQKKEEKKILFTKDQIKKIFEKGEEIKKEIERIEEEKKKEEERKKLEEERKRKEEIRKEIEKEIKRRIPIGWICNAYRTFHPAPGFFYECADPSKGGRWVFEDS